MAYCQLAKLDLKNPLMVEKWDNFANSHKDGHHHHSDFLKFIISSYKHKHYSVMTIDENGNVTGILPLFHTKSIVFGEHLTSLPFLNYGGIIAIDADAAEMMEEHVLKLNAVLTPDTAVLRHNAPNPMFDARRYAVETHKANMCLELPDDNKLLGVGNAKKRTKLRSQASLAVRKAESENAVLKQVFGKTELIDDFYTVMKQHMHYLGSPVHAKSFFKNASKHLGEKAIITVTYWNDEPVSCGFLINHGDRMSIPWASCLSKMNKYSLNANMYWNILSYAIEGGFKTFDFGRSTINEGTYKFKAQWGAEPEICYWYNLAQTKNSDTLDAKPSSSVKADDFSLAVTLWKKMPLFIANIVGPVLVKNIP